MSESSFDHLVKRIKSDRDELRLQMHLASLETQDEWRKLEDKWHSIEPKLSAFAKEAKSSAQDVGDATQDVATELGKAYHRLKKSLKS